MLNHLTSPVGVLTLLATLVSLVATALAARRGPVSRWFDGALAGGAAILALSALGHGMTLLLGFEAVARVSREHKVGILTSSVEQAGFAIGLGVGAAALLAVWAFLWSRVAPPAASDEGVPVIRGVGAGAVALGAGLSLMAALGTHAWIWGLAGQPNPNWPTMISAMVITTEGLALITVALVGLFVPVRLWVVRRARSSGGRTSSIDNAYGVGAPSSE